MWDARWGSDARCGMPFDYKAQGLRYDSTGCGVAACQIQLLTETAVIGVRGFFLRLRSTGI